MRKRDQASLDQASLDELVEEITLDANEEDEQLSRYLIKRRSLPKEHLAHVPICAAVSSWPLCAVVTLRL